MKVMISADYRTFLAEIKERIHKAQYDAFKAVNKELIQLYWDIGKSIVAKHEKLGWGKAIVETLAKDLQKEFPGVQGFSVQNLWNMRQFYSAYKDNPKLQPMVGEISWTKNVIIMQRCKDDIQREFYIKITEKFGWTKDVLINQLEAGAKEVLNRDGRLFCICRQSISAGDRRTGVFHRFTAVSSTTALPYCNRVKGRGIQA